MRRTELNSHTPPASGRSSTFRISRLRLMLAGIGLAASLGMPGAASALGIGELTLHSKLGQPLLARVPLSLEANETLDASCLSLQPAVAGEEDAAIYMTRLRLSLTEENGAHTVTIRSNSPMNEPFAKVRLQVKCQDAPAFIRTFTLLPEFDETILPSQPATEKADASDRAAAPGTGTASTRPATTSGPSAPGKPRPQGQKRTAQASKPRAPSSVPAPKGGTEGAQLKLSGAAPDIKHPGDHAKQALTEKRIQDADDQTAKILALQQQIKQMEEQLNLLNLKLAQYAPASAVATAPATTMPASEPLPAIPAPASAAEAASAPAVAAPASAPKPQPAAAAPTPSAPGSFLEQGTTFIAAAALSVLLLLLGLLRLNRKRKAEWNAPEDETSPSSTEQTLTALAQSAHEAASPAAEETAHTHSPVEPTPEPPPAPAAPVDEIAQEDEAYLAARQAHTLPSADDLPSLIEEAELYALHGYPDKGQEILQDIVEKHPDYQEAWSLLFSILSSLGKKSEFESNARRFATLYPHAKNWNEISTLGKQLDANNPLYAESAKEEATITQQPASARRKPIGEILLETGAISVDDLMHSLANFDPKRDGRIGNYLISLGMITQVDLENALRVQEGGASAPAQPAAAPKDEQAVDPLPHILEFEPSKPAEPPKE
ncbi:MAG: hypothetical protein AB1400_01520 [Pseudomonadota bacterium]